MTSNEFIFGPREKVDAFARSKRWRPSGRAAWLTPKGTCVHFLAFEDQLAAICKGERVYVAGKLGATALRRLRKLEAEIVEVATL